MTHTIVGADIAKNVMQVHWVNAGTGEIVNRSVKRAAFLEYFANRRPCLIGMESCSGSQHWARRLIEMGHQVKLMPAKFVKLLTQKLASQKSEGVVIANITNLWNAFGRPVSVKKA